MFSLVHQEGNSALHLAASNGHLNLLLFLLSSTQLSPLLKNSQGQTTLHLAAKHNQQEVLNYLLDEYRLNPFEVDGNGKTARDLAQDEQHTDLVSYLAKKEVQFDRMYMKSTGIGCEDYQAYQECLQAAILVQVRFS